MKSGKKRKKKQVFMAVCWSGARVSPGRTFCTSLTLSPHTVKPKPSWSFCTTTHLWTRPVPGRGGQEDVKSILKEKHKAECEVELTRTLSRDVDRWLPLLGGRGFALRVPDGQTAEPGFERGLESMKQY